MKRVATVIRFEYDWDDELFPLDSLKRDPIGCAIGAYLEPDAHERRETHERHEVMELTVAGQARTPPAPTMASSTLILSHALGSVGYSLVYVGGASAASYPCGVARNATEAEHLAWIAESAALFQRFTFIDRRGASHR